MAKQKKKKRLPLWAQIMIGLGAGVAFGLVASTLGWKQFSDDWIAPWGTIFMNLLKLIAVPLIFISLTNGISNLTDISRLSRIGLKTIVIYVLTTTIAITIGLSLVNITHPGTVFPKEKRDELQQMYAQNVKEKEQVAINVKEQGPLQFVVDMVPDNIVQSMSNNKMMLQVIFFSMLFGISMVMLPEKKIKPMKDVLNSLNDIVLKLIDIIMGFAPIGVFALIGSLIVDIVGDNPSEAYGLFASLGIYCLTVILGLLILVFLFYPLLIKFFTKIPLKHFFSTMFPTQLLAFSTSSSAATLPLNMERVERDLKVDEEVVSFVLPVGATINMDGTSLYQAVAAVFIAEVFGIDLTMGQQLTIVLTALLASIGTAAVPGAGIVMLVVVLSAIGVPTAGIALIFAVDRPLDMLRTVVNVTSDATVCSIVASSEKMIEPTVNKN